MRLGRIALVPVAIVVIAAGAALLIPTIPTRSGKSEPRNAVNLALNQRIENGVARPVAVTGSATYRAVRTQFSATLDNAKSVLHGRPGNAVVRANSDKFTAAFTGELSAAGTARGDLTFNAPSLRQLAAWAGSRCHPATGSAPSALTRLCRRRAASTS
jgi:hypothetical protein